MMNGCEKRKTQPAVQNLKNLVDTPMLEKLTPHSYGIQVSLRHIYVNKYSLAKRTAVLQSGCAKPMAGRTEEEDATPAKRLPVE